jgi:hypothetical protein
MLGQTANEGNTSGQATYTANPSGSLRTGAVSAYEPGQNITINSTTETHPTRYVVAKGVQYQKQGGGTIEASLIRQGAKVQLNFDTEGQVDRIILIDQQ